jgi:hypothetical protein
MKKNRLWLGEMERVPTWLTQGGFLLIAFTGVLATGLGFSEEPSSLTKALLDMAFLAGAVCVVVGLGLAIRDATKDRGS